MSLELVFRRAAEDALDEAVARAGFDPAEERRTAFMVREKVLAAIGRSCNDRSR